MRNNFITSIELVLTVLAITLVLTLFQCSKITKSKKILKETNDYIYVIKYKPFNTDSTVYKYHQPTIDKAKVVELKKNYYIEFINIKTKENFSCRSDKNSYKLIETNKNKIYKFKHVYYPKEEYILIE